jgi:hypothetical protein
VLRDRPTHVETPRRGNPLVGLCSHRLFCHRYYPINGSARGSSMSAKAQRKSGERSPVKPKCPTEVVVDAAALGCRQKRRTPPPPCSVTDCRPVLSLAASRTFCPNDRTSVLKTCPQGVRREPNQGWPRSCRCLWQLPVWHMAKPFSEVRSGAYRLHASKPGLPPDCCGNHAESVVRSAKGTTPVRTLRAMRRGCSSMRAGAQKKG